MLRIFQAHRGKSRVWFTGFEQRWNEDESSSPHRETVAFTMRVKPGLIEEQQRQRRQQQSCVHTSQDKVHFHKERELQRGQNLDCNSWMTDVEKTFLWNAHLQLCLLRHHDRRHSEEARATYSDVVLPVLITGSIQKSQVNWKENSRVRSGRIAFTAEASNLKIGDIRAIRRPWADYSTKNDELRKDSLQEYNSSTPWIKHEIISLLQQLEW